MTPSPSRQRFPLRLAPLALAALLLSACAPTPTPTPTPLFSSDAEAFAAAEATYRAYTDALNAVDFSDAHTFEAVYSLLTDEAEDSTRKAFSEFHAEDIRTSGATRFDTFTGVSADPSSGVVNATLCVDVSDVTVVNASGASIVSPDRPSRQPLDITFSTAADNTKLSISEMGPSEDLSCAR